MPAQFVRNGLGIGCQPARQSLEALAILEFAEFLAIDLFQRLGVARKDVVPIGDHRLQGVEINYRAKRTKARSGCHFLHVRQTKRLSLIHI